MSGPLRLFLLRTFPEGTSAVFGCRFSAVTDEWSPLRVARGVTADARKGGPAIPRSRQGVDIHESR